MPGFPDDPEAVFGIVVMVGNLQCVSGANIDHMAAVVFHIPGVLLTVAQMNMTVEQIFGVILVQQLDESLETLVSRVGVVAQSFRRGMGHHDVHTAQLPQGVAQEADPAAHLGFGVLVGAFVIPAAATQSQDPQSTVLDDGIVDAVTALRRVGRVACIVVSVDL